MKKITFSALFLSLMIGISENASAQSLKDLLNSSTVKNAVTSVTGGEKIAVGTLIGKWTYENPAVKLEGDNALKNVAGSVAATEMENKLKAYFTKAGIIEGVFNYTFNEDGTFTSLLKGKTLKGTYTVNEEAKTVEFVYGSLGKGKLNTFTAHAVVSGKELTLLFNADKVLKMVSTLSSISNNTTLKAVSQLANEYEGMKMGFDLKK